MGNISWKEEEKKKAFLLIHFFPGSLTHTRSETYGL